jgi:hypothetical protein
MLVSEKILPFGYGLIGDGNIKYNNSAGYTPI